MVFFYCRILTLFRYTPPVKSWSVSHREGYFYIAHYRHIEEVIDRIEIVWYISLTSDTTTVYLRLKCRLTNENAIYLIY